MFENKQYNVKLIPKIANEEGYITKSQMETAKAVIAKVGESGKITKQQIKDALGIQDDKLLEYLLNICKEFEIYVSYDN